MKTKVLVILLILLAAGTAAWWYAGTPATEIAAPTALTASGFIEARTVEVSTEIPGRIEVLAVDEGDVVRAGQRLVVLDAALLRAKRDEGEAALQMAEANLAWVQAGTRPGTVAEAEATIEQAQAARDAAERSYQDVFAARDNPQELDLKVAQSRAALAVAEAKVTEATHTARAAQTWYDFLARTTGDARDAVEEGVSYSVEVPGQGTVSGRTFANPVVLDEASYRWNVAGQDLSLAYEALNAARAERDAARTRLDDLLAIRAEPLQADAAVFAARAGLETAQVAVETARAQRDLTAANPTPAEVDAARAQVEGARAALRALDVQLAKTEVTAPLDAMVTSRALNQGEMAAPGVPILTLTDLRRLELVVYVPQRRLNQVSLDQSVRVHVDSFPERTFAGRVQTISPEAAFTPANVQTQDERVRTTVAVTLALDNEDLALKPGMPADAGFGGTR